MLDQPAGGYSLDLSVSDCRTVAQCLMLLTEEPGTNLQNCWYNGNLFAVSERWLQEVPHNGVFACEFVTKKGQASPFIRLDLARRLLLPGARRWEAIPPELLVPDQSCEEADTEPEVPEVELNVDGSLCHRGYLANLAVVYTM